MSVKPTPAAKPSLPPLSLSPTKGPAEKPKPSIGPLPDKKAKLAGKPVDTSGLESVHERSKSGEWGTPLRKASEAGDFWAKSGIRGGLEEARREITLENLKNLVTD